MIEDQPPEATPVEEAPKKSHWTTLETPAEIRQALRDLMGMVVAKKLDLQRARELRANLESQLRFAMARERKISAPKKASHPSQVPGFQDLEATEALAIEVAHREIARLAAKEALSAREARQLQVYTQLITASKVLLMREFELRRRLGTPDMDKARQVAQQVLPPELKGDK